MWLRRCCSKQLAAGEKTMVGAVISVGFYMILHTCSTVLAACLFVASEKDDQVAATRDARQKIPVSASIHPSPPLSLDILG